MQAMNGTLTDDKVVVVFWSWCTRVTNDTRVADAHRDATLAQAS